MAPSIGGSPRSTERSAWLEASTVNGGRSSLAIDDTARASEPSLRAGPAACRCVIDFFDGGHVPGAASQLADRRADRSGRPGGSEHTSAVGQQVQFDLLAWLDPKMLQHSRSAPAGLAAPLSTGKCPVSWRRSSTFAGCLRQQLRPDPGPALARLVAAPPPIVSAPRSAGRALPRTARGPCAWCCCRARRQGASAPAQCRPAAGRPPRARNAARGSRGCAPAP